MDCAVKQCIQHAYCSSKNLPIKFSGFAADPPKLVLTNPHHFGGKNRSSPSPPWWASKWTVPNTHWVFLSQLNFKFHFSCIESRSWTAGRPSQVDHLPNSFCGRFHIVHAYAIYPNVAFVECLIICPPFVHALFYRWPYCPYREFKNSL